MFFSPTFVRKLAFAIHNSPELDHVKNFQHIFQKCSLWGSMNHTLASEDQELHWRRFRMVQPPAKKQINYPSGAWSNRLQKENKQIIIVVDGPTACKKPNRN